ncbi:hypothetical protein KY311_00900 [Candidatus Woesearchaeota archaeon]|nr:hypothetical protein [Candidatus Woesearchaeota archaeon]
MGEHDCLESLVKIATSRLGSARAFALNSDSKHFTCYQCRVCSELYIGDSAKEKVTRYEGVKTAAEIKRQLPKLDYKKAKIYLS